VEVDEGPRVRSTILAVAVAAFLLLVVQVVHSWPEPEREPRYRLDLARVTQVGATPRADDVVLHAALVVWSPDDAAIVDARAAVLAPGKPFDLQMAFRSPRADGRQQGSGRFADMASDALPADFGTVDVELRVAGRYLGERDAWHGVQFTSCAGEHDLVWPGGGGTGGSLALPPDDLLVRDGQPVARLSEPNSVALFLRVSKVRDGAAFAAGSRAAWLDAFLANVDADPLPPRESPFPELVDADLQKSPQSGPEHRFEPQGNGSVADLLAAGYVLGDARAVAMAAERLRAPGVLEDVLAAAAHERGSLSGSFAEDRYDEPRRAVTQALVRGVTPQLDAVHSIPRALKLLAVTDRAALARDLGAYLREGALWSPLRRLALERDSFGASPVPRTEFGSVRDAVIARLGFPWGTMLRSSWLLFAWLLFPPVLALVFVWRVRALGSRPSRTFVPTGSWLVAVALLSVTSIGGFSLRALLVPLWWSLAWMLLRRGESRDAALRGVVWLALSLATIDGLQIVRWYTTHETVAAVAPHGVLFGWCLVGLSLAKAGQWRRVDRFAQFVASLVVVGFAQILLDDALSGRTMWPLAVLPAGLFVSFLLGGRRERRPMLAPVA